VEEFWKRGGGNRSSVCISEVVLNEEVVLAVCTFVNQFVSMNNRVIECVSKREREREREMFEFVSERAGGRSCSRCKNVCSRFFCVLFVCVSVKEKGVRGFCR